MSNHRKARGGIRGLIERNCREQGPIVVRAAFMSTSTNELLKDKGQHRADDSAGDSADKHIAPVDPGKGFRFLPVPFFLGLVIGSVITRLLLRLLMDGK